MKILVSHDDHIKFYLDSNSDHQRINQTVSSGTRLEAGSYEVGDYGINISEKQRVSKI